MPLAKAVVPPQTANISLKQIINTVFTRGASTAINFMIAVLIARHAGAAVKGDVTLLITITYFFIFFSNILGGQALVYLIPRNKIELLVVPAYIWTAFISIVGFAFLQSTFLIKANHVTSITVLSFLSSVISIHQTVLFAKKEIQKANRLTVVSLALQLTGILFCFYQLGISNAFAYIYASLAAYTLTAIYSFDLARTHIRFADFRKDFSWTELKESFRYGLLFQFTEILQLLNLRYYFFQLGIQQGAQYLGVYSVGIALLEAVWIIPRSISSVHYVSTSNSVEVQKELQRTINLVKLSIAISAVGLFFIFCIPSSAIVYVFGDGFKQVKHSIRFLFPGILVYNFLLVVSSFYYGIGKYRPLILANATGAIALIILSYFLLPPYVISGAGLAASVSFSIASFVLFVQFVITYKISLSQFVYTKHDWKRFVALVKNL